MRIWTIVTVVVVVAMGISAAPVAAQNDRLVIVIDTFENPDTHGSSTIGNALTDMFITSLSRTGAFTVMDGRGGEPIEADLFLGAKITNFSYQEEEVAATDRRGFRDSDSARMFQQTINVRIDLTAVDYSQEILFAEAVEQSETNTSSSARAGDFNRLVTSRASVSEMLSSMMGRATEGAIERAVERLTTYFEILGPITIAGSVEGSIVALVDSRTAVIDKGGFSGLGTGDELEVLRDEPVTNAAGQVVFLRETNIGTAAVSEVQDEGALIDVAPGVEVREGDIVVRRAPSSSPSEYISRGTAFFEAGFNGAALREFQRARDSDLEAAEAAEVDYGLGIVYMKTGDSDAAFENLGRFLDAGGTIEWTAVHRHTFGSCSGTFTLTGSTASFRSPDENDPDHYFEVPFTAIRQVRHSQRLEGDFLELRAPSAEQFQKNEGDSKNWSFRFHVNGQHSGPARFVMRAISAP